MSPTRQIPFGKPLITTDEQEAVLNVLRGTVLTHGPQCHDFEREFAQWIGGGYCVSVSSCTAALHLAYLEMGVGPGDEVLVPAQTHTATAHAVEYVGAKPVFVDCELKTGNVDCSQMESLITSKTKAISVVHFLGVPCEMDKIFLLAERYQLRVIEDCALALGTRYKNIHAGLWGDAGCFSFYPAKHMTTAEGGMFVTKHKAVAERVAPLRAFGVDRSFSERTLPGMYDVMTLGYNYRMSEIQAAMGREQLKKIKGILRQRKANYFELKSLLDGQEGLSILGSGDSGDIENSFYCLSLLLPENLEKHRPRVMGLLKEAGIGTSIYYPHPVPRLHYYQKKYGFKSRDFVNASAISDRSIALPVGAHLNDEDVQFMAEQVKVSLGKVTKTLQTVGEE